MSSGKGRGGEVSTFSGSAKDLERVANSARMASDITSAGSCLMCSCFMSAASAEAVGGVADLVDFGDSLWGSNLTKAGLSDDFVLLTEPSMVKIDVGGEGLRSASVGSGWNEDAAGLSATPPS